MKDIIYLKDQKDKAVKVLEQFSNPSVVNVFVLDVQCIRFLIKSDKNTSLPKSGPPERWVVLTIADL